MGKTRNIPDLQLFPAVSGRIIIDTWRGQMRIRKWPRKRGSKATPAQAANRKLFTSARHLTKFIAPEFQYQVITAAKGTGLYPSDILMRAMLKGVYDIAERDGKIITNLTPTLERVMFQGARVQRTGNFAVASGALRIIPWQDPILNPSLMWNIAAPSRLTIPNEVTVVNASFGWVFTATVNTTLIASVLKNGTEIASHFWHNGQWRAGCITTGPISVAAGDYLEAGIFTSINTTLAAEARLNFGAHIIGTT